MTVERANASIHEFPKPTIAMIRGYCIGGGLGLAVCCDLRICSDNSRFAIPAAKLGLGYGYPGMKRLTDVVGPAFAKEIFFTARQFDAEEARTMGLVNRVVPEAELEAYVKSYAETIAGNAPLTVKTAKHIVNEAMKDESKRDLARCRELVEQCFASNDYTEGRTGLHGEAQAGIHRDVTRSAWLGAAGRRGMPSRTVWCFNVHTARAAANAAGKREARAWRRLNCAV